MPLERHMPQTSKVNMPDYHQFVPLESIILISKVNTGFFDDPPLPQKLTGEGQPETVAQSVHHKKARKSPRLLLY